jgi:hypothetical protein
LIAEARGYAKGRACAEGNTAPTFGTGLPAVNARSAARFNLGCDGGWPTMRLITRRVAPVLMCGATALAAGCATLTTGSAQTVTILSEPAGAACILHRDGAVIGAVNPTPGSIAIAKGHGEIAVRCSRDGFIDAEQRLTAGFQAATLGNILLGGLIGVVVDAASGASGRYEAQLWVLMVPVEFASAGERDRFFEARRAGIASRAQQQQEEVRRACSTGDCEPQLKKLRDAEAQALAQTERQRSEARLRPAS